MKWSPIARALLLAALAPMPGCDALPSPLEAAVASLQVSPPTATLQVGGSVQLEAVPLDAAGKPLAGREVLWSIENPAVAEVSPTGLVRATGAGSTRVVVRSGDRSAAATISVTPPEPAAAGSVAELPRTLLDTRYTPPSGRRTPVRRGDDLQAALNAAQPGDILLLEAGATFTGNFELPAKAGAGWVVIRTAAPDAELPPEGTRITPAFARVMPKILTSNTQPAIRTAAGADHYRIMGVEIGVAASQRLSYGIVALGDGSGDQDTAEEVPHNLVLDRVYVHGHPELNVSRCVALNSAFSAVVDSYLAECHGKGFDAQAIGGWNGPGPFKIVNNYLEGSGENVMFGGADAAIRDLVPSDIEIRRNHFYKPTSWRGVWTVKNLFELKNAQRVLVDGNVLENNWLDGQIGFAVLLTPRNQDGGNPWAVVRDVTFTHNIVRHSSSGVNILGQDYNHPSQQTRNLLFAHNLFYGIDRARWGGHGYGFMFTGLSRDVHLRHNTLVLGNRFLQFEEGGDRKNSAIVATDNLSCSGGIGGHAYAGVEALDWAVDRWTTKGNVLCGVEGNLPYPPGNSYPGGMDAVGFAGAAAHDFRLAPTSAFRGKATDGADPGADIPAVLRATSGVVR